MRLSLEYRNSLFAVLSVILLGVVMPFFMDGFHFRLIAFPINLIILSLMVLIAVAFVVLQRRRPRLGFVCGVPVSVTLITALLLLSLVKGFSINKITGSWSFVLLFLFMLEVLAVVIVRRMLHFRFRDIPFYLNHLGLWILLAAASFGYADRQRYVMYVDEGATESMIYDQYGNMKKLPLSVHLNDFRIDMTRQNQISNFVSDVQVTYNDKSVGRSEIRVNQPLTVDSWMIYQDGYDVQKGSDSTYSSFLLVYDPWLEMAYCGIIMLMAGSLYLSVLSLLRRWRFVWLSSLLFLSALVFVIISITHPGLFTGNLVPALQSIWFIPHVTSYIFSYSMLAAATVAAVIQLSGRDGRSSLLPFIDNMVNGGFGFLMLGLLMGALWAKQTWGEYWSWDIKETWAFATTAAYLGYIHLRLCAGIRTQKAALWLLPAAFIILMITWLGVNYLPSASDSLHVY